jgi:hypothetical protein
MRSFEDAKVDMYTKETDLGDDDDDAQWPKGGPGELEMASESATSFPISIWKTHLVNSKNKTSEMCGLVS